MRCITQNRISLLSIKMPCVKCGKDSSPGALNSFQRTMPNLFRKILEEDSATKIQVQVPIMRVPMVAALCCPRVMSGSGEGVPGDNRMKYTGLNDARWMTWTCRTCSRVTSLRKMPHGWNSHFCFRHGAMCYTLPSDDRERPFWSCCDNAMPIDDVPLIISHVLHYRDDSLPNSSQVVADVEISHDEEMLPVDPLRRDDDDDPALQEGAAYEAEATALEEIARRYCTDGDHSDGDPMSQEAGALAAEEATIARIVASYDDDDHNDAGALERTADHVLTRPEDRLQQLLEEYEACSVVAGSM